MENHTISVDETSTRPQNSDMPKNRRRNTHTQMRVKKRNGSFESVDLNKIVKAIDRCCDGLDCVDTLRVATRTISGLYDGATTQELDELSIQTASSFMAEEPEYSFLAGRLLSNYIEKEVANQNIWSFSQSIEVGY
jgi:ribonucleoside-diphosphate reductase alpha chain